MQPVQPACFDPDMTADLPEPARKYFLYSIEPGTPLYRVAKISMSGRFGMGTRANHSYLSMTATQILAMPAGFIWKNAGIPWFDDAFRVGQRVLDTVLVDGTVASGTHGRGHGS